MDISRGQFLRSLGKSLPGFAIGSATTLGARLLAAAQPAVSTPLPATPPGIAFLKEGPATGRRIALTFDDGPAPGSTETILDELKSRGCKATFFMIGRKIALHPEIARRVLAEGHEIGNHTFTHPKLPTLTDAQAEQEIHDTQQQLTDLLDYRAAWFRPPFGEMRQSQAALAQRLGLRIALWNVEAADWMRPPRPHLVETILSGAQPGSIILCHDNQENTAMAVGEIIDGLLTRDFKPVTLSELFA